MMQKWVQHSFRPRMDRKMIADGWSNWIAFWLFMIFTVLFSTYCSMAYGEESSHEFEVYSMGLSENSVDGGVVGSYIGIAESRFPERRSQ